VDSRVKGLKRRPMDRAVINQLKVVVLGMLEQTMKIK
jgi:hypothetical protein